MPAAKAATRLSPLDGKNFNRCFPGNPAGTVSEIIAHYLTTVLFPLADVVIDIHTGGRSMDFYPCAHMHLVPAGPQREQMLAGTEAWNTDFCFLYADIAGTGLLPVEAENQGKIVLTTEMGGSENVTAQVHRQTQSGLRNVLMHFGVLEGKPQTRADLGLAADALGAVARLGGLPLRPRVGRLREHRAAGRRGEGRANGRGDSLSRTAGARATPVVANSDGILIATRAPSIVTQGDCVACIAHEIPSGQLSPFSG